MSYNTLRALLITSLIVNTLLIGYIIGGATSKQRPKWSPPMMLKDFHRDTFMGGERRLPPMLTQSFKESEQSLKSLRKAVRASRHALADTLKETDINPSKVEAALAKHIELSNEYKSTSQRALVDTIASMPAEDRQHIMRRLRRATRFGEARHHN